LAWVLAQKDFIVPIPETTKLERLKENIKVTEIKFTKVEAKSMNEALSQMDIESRRFEPDSDFEKRVGL
jgi:aryl-alcohol dehydrogenase-like predicted oxidoreductase